MPKGLQAKGLAMRDKMLLAAITHFLADGYEKTTTASIAKAAGMSASSFFAAFETKEALLLLLVKHMFSNQFNEIFSIIGSNAEPVMIYAAETSLQLYLSELSEPLRELYVTAYSLPSTSVYIYRSTAERLQGIFGEYLPNAQAKDFYEMEIASAGIMRSFMAVPCDLYFTAEVKIARFLDCALKLYNVPEEKRAAVTAAVLRLDLHTRAADIIQKTVQQAEKGFEALTEK